LANPFPPGAVVVITGATSGIGRAAAHAFAEAGARLALCGRGQEALDDAVSECAQRGADVVGHVVDVGEAVAVDAFAKAVVDRYGRIDVWINSAAVLQYGRFEETPSAVVEQVVRTNLIGCFNGSRAALTRFRAQGSGVLINTASVLGLFGHPFTAAYVATKFAIRGFTASLRQEVQDLKDVHVCAVLPAAIDTPIYRRAANYLGREVTPIRPLYSPMHVARAFVALARRPRREIGVGAFVGVAALGASVAPVLAERIVRLSADVMEVRRRPSPATPGNLFHPDADGHAVQGGWRRRFGPTADGRVLLGAAAVAAVALALAGRGALRRPNN
jgi:NAD(P)-dependent dehydrogenase (short-subunit alcohol dehydrogenase family)